MIAAAERRAYWLSIVALVVALPLAIIVQSRGEIIGWARTNMRPPVTVERGTVQDYAGMKWRLAALTKLPGNLPDTVVVLAEFELIVDPVQSKDSLRPCEVTLIDNRGWRWEPSLLTRAAIVREVRPDVVDRPRCGDFAKGDATGKVLMAETFLIPSDAEDLTVSVSMREALPDRLVFR